MEGAGESVLAGGRYDKLISGFDMDTPATGFGVNMSTVVDTLMRSGNDGSDKKKPNELVAFESNSLGYALEYCASHVDCELSPVAGHEENLNYARKNGIASVRFFDGAVSTVVNV
jgi:ATP phosphoribosyltransferase regulatory subunit